MLWKHLALSDIIWPSIDKTTVRKLVLVLSHWKSKCWSTSSTTPQIYCPLLSLFLSIYGYRDLREWFWGLSQYLSLQSRSKEFHWRIKQTKFRPTQKTCVVLEGPKKTQTREVALVAIRTSQIDVIENYPCRYLFWRKTQTYLYFSLPIGVPNINVQICQKNTYTVSPVHCCW